MNKAKLKSYAPQARKDFIQMIRQRADLLGLTKKTPEETRVEGEVAVIEGRPYPVRYAKLHKRLAQKIDSEGLEQFIERVAYSWFNRFAALRFMEVNGFLSHGFRILSNRVAGKDEPEVLTHAPEIDLPGLPKEKIIELKLAGNRDAELYRLLIIAQCNELNRAMPFLFERINDETEILLPDNLLATDSVIRKMVSAIDEEDWQQVEIIGWLYQFYISEKKDEVIGKTVASDDIPAATQLFTPNWIVKYMTQNSLGRLWLEKHPESQLAKQMEFYIEPSVENETSNDEQNSSSFKPFFHPGSIKILDPACGSGHILVEAYDLLKAIYIETGFSSRDIPSHILGENLFGLDIDERACQLSSFALLMKARADDPKIFEKLKEANRKNFPNILTVPDSSLIEIESEHIAEILANPSSDLDIIRKVENYAPGKLYNDIIRLLETFAQGKTLGSLIRIPADLGIPELNILLEERRQEGNLLEQSAAKALEPFLRTAKLLAQKYDCVIANPPYMGGKGMNAELKQFAAKNFPDSKSDLFAMFIERNLELAKKDGFSSMVTMQSWMFLSSFEKMREKLLDEKTIISMAHLGARAFVEISGEVVQTTSFVMTNKHSSDFKPTFFRLVELSEPEKVKALRDGEQMFNNTKQDDFKKIPGSPIAYWVSDKVREIFEMGMSLGENHYPRQGMATGDNERFVRFWCELDFNKVNLTACSKIQGWESKKKWFPFNKGGSFRKWYGNNENLLSFDEASYLILKTMGNQCPSEHFYFKPGVTWGKITSGHFSTRINDFGYIFSDAGMKIVFENYIDGFDTLAFTNSKLVPLFLSALSSTLNYETGSISILPVFRSLELKKEITEECVSIARADWDSFETSWDFQSLPFLGVRGQGSGESKKGEEGISNLSALTPNPSSTSVEECWNAWRELTEERLTRMQELETENNRLFIEAYGLQDELSPEVPPEQITLARADAEKDVRRLMSYFIGCLMGRYSLDEPGLVYADAGGHGFDRARYQTFPADDDGIVPVTDLEWFPQDVARQFEKFIAVAFEDTETRRHGDGEKEITASPRRTVSASQNLQWIAEKLGGKANETPIETIRRYFSTEFFKNHLQTYKKRPIYWLFSSGKNKAFECLVYLHRYNEATLPRMRHEYVLPLMSKLTAQIEDTDKLIEQAVTTAEKTKLQKQLESFRKKQTELAQFDEKLRHCSDMRISLDLDDGVKVNYGKFGDLLAEVKQVATVKE